MRKIFVAAGIAGMALMSSWGMKPAEARTYPWCAHYIGSGAGGAPNCGFRSYRQCMAAASGQGSNCQRNPAYHGNRSYRYR